MTAQSRRPTEGELAILHVIWDHGPLSVRAIHQVLTADKPTGYTTVLKLLQIMTAKGLVDRDDSVRPQIYKAHFSRAQTQRQLLRDLSERAFGGSLKTLVLAALGNRKPSAEELRTLEALLDRHEKERS